MDFYFLSIQSLIFDNRSWVSDEIDFIAINFYFLEVQKFVLVTLVYQLCYTVIFIWANQHFLVINLCNNMLSVSASCQQYIMFIRVSCCTCFS